MLEGNWVKHVRQQAGKRPNAASALTSEEEEILWTAKTLGDSSSGILSQTMWWKATENSKYLEAVYYSGNRPRKWRVFERLRWRKWKGTSGAIAYHTFSRTPQTTTSNSFLGFSVWYFPTSTEQIQQASSHRAFTVSIFLSDARSWDWAEIGTHIFISICNNPRHVGV